MNGLWQRNIFLLLCVLFSMRIFSNAQILEGLKDAVLTAEGTINELFRSFNSFAKHIKFTKEAFQDTVEEECKFSCPNGKTPKKNKYHKPSSNGCGVPGLEVNMEYMALAPMTKCCDQHDICYGTCNKNKDDCDLVFKKCLYKLCDKVKEDITESFSTGCKAAAKMLYSGTTAFGCKFYKDAQREACYCPSQRFTGDEL